MYAWVVCHRIDQLQGANTTAFSANTNNRMACAITNAPLVVSRALRQERLSRSAGSNGARSRRAGPTRADTHAVPRSLPHSLRRYQERDGAPAAVYRRGERLGRPFEGQLLADADVELVLRG
jgi:hypothetical protein